MFDKPEKSYQGSAKFRAYGRARIEIARRAQSRQDWDALWKKPQHGFPFKWGEHWKQCIEYRVDDFAAEVGFFIDVLGLPVNAFDAEYAMFTGPNQDFFFAVIPTPEGSYSTPADALRIQFMVADLFETCEELTRRGILFDQEPQPLAEGSSIYIATFHTPHGISVDLWGIITLETVEEEQTGSAIETGTEQSLEEDDDQDELLEEKDVASLLKPQSKEAEEDSNETEEDFTEVEEHKPEYVEIDENAPEYHYRPIPLKSGPRQLTKR